MGKNCSIRNTPNSNLYTHRFFTYSLEMGTYWRYNFYCGWTWFYSFYCNSQLCNEPINMANFTDYTSNKYPIYNCWNAILS